MLVAMHCNEWVNGGNGNMLAYIAMCHESGLKANYSGMSLPGANLRGLSLRGADFTGANLTNADLSGADFTGADLSGASLFGANLTSTNFTGADLSGADLRNTSSANNTVFTDADLSDAKLGEASQMVRVYIVIYRESGAIRSQSFIDDREAHRFTSEKLATGMARMYSEVFMF